MEFNNQQKAIFAAVADTEDNLIVDAVAGAGKTTTIVEACAYLNPIEFDTGFIAFETHVAGQLRAKLNGMAEASTFHSLGRSFLCGNLPSIDVRKNKYWKVVQGYMKGDYTLGGLFSSPAPLVALTHAVRDTKAKLTGTGMYTLSNRMGILGIRAAGSPDWERVAGHVKECIKIGTKQALKQGVIDFTDMLWLPVFKGWTRKIYDVTFVDETQDLNSAKVSMLMQISNRIIAVGDPHQSIYAFTGAMSDSMEVVQATFDAKKYPLSTCFRCPSSHLDLARKYCKTIQPAPWATEGFIDEISESSLGYEASKPFDPADRPMIISRTRAPLVKTFIDLISDGHDATIKGDETLVAITKLITVLEREYSATMKNIRSVAELYFDDQKGRITSTFNGGGESIISSERDNIDALNTLISAFPEFTSVKQLKAKIKSLARLKTGVSLSTIHGAKGMESKRVYVLGFDRMPLKHSHMTEEQKGQEKNLQLIATTRSKESLIFVDCE